MDNLEGAGPGSTTKVGQVEIQMEVQQKLLDLMGGFVESICVKMSPVTREEPPLATEKEGKPKVCLVPLAKKIKSSNGKIDSYTKTLKRLIGSLEL